MMPLLLFLSAVTAFAAPSDIDILRRRLELYRVLWPHPVDDALASLKGPVSIDVECPDDPLPDDVPSIANDGRFLPAQTVTISVRTFPSAWKPKTHGADGRDGNYSWNLPQNYTADGTREEVVAENELALDPKATAGLRAPQVRAQIPSVVLLYHELLHGQLMMDAMRGDENWQADFCSFHRPAAAERRMLGASDADHRLIQALEDQFSAVLEKVVLGRDAEGQNPWSPLPKTGKK